MATINSIESLRERLGKGLAIPAMPLALDAQRRFDATRQAALARYYIDAGAGGVAVGVHSTQFEIRDPGVGLFEPVLRQTAGALDAWSERRGRSTLKIAGICGPTPQALGEAEFALSAGYDAGLLSLSALREATVDELVEHCERVAQVLPVIGFYLQPAVGGRVLPYEFWQRFAEIPNVVAIKIAPFNRYQTFDVVRAVAEAGRAGEVHLYTGNDDNIVVDLLTRTRIRTSAGAEVEMRIVGGLLGHWCVWTKRAVELLERLQGITASGGSIPAGVLTLAQEVTDMNAALFDAKNGFAGCIPGLHEVLRRQGLLAGTWCLNPREVLSPGQAEELERVTRSYPHLVDDEFVREHLDEWMAG